MVSNRRSDVYGSIAAAAQDLHVTHGAVSRQVKALEADLDEPLLRRSGRGVRLTPAGELFQPELEWIRRIELYSWDRPHFCRSAATLP